MKSLHEYSLKFRQSAGRLLDELESVGGILPWVILTTAIAMLVPFALFLSTIVFSEVNSTDYLVLLYGVYLLVSLFCHINGYGRIVEEKIGYKKAVFFSVVMFALGLGLVYVGIHVLPSAILQVAGMVLCSLGHCLLALAWYQHFSRFSPTVCSFSVIMSAVLCLVLYSIFSLIDLRYRIFVLAAIYLIVPVLAVFRVPRYSDTNTRVATLFLDTDVFVQQNKKMLYIFVFLGGISFGFCTALIVSTGTFLTPEPAIPANLIVGVSIIVLLVVGFCAFLMKAHSSVVVLLNTVVFFMIIGAFATANSDFVIFGEICLCSGYLLLNALVLLLSAQVSRLQLHVDKSYGEIYRKIFTTFPVSLLTAYGLCLLCEAYAPVVIRYLPMIYGACMLAFYITMFSKEVKTTREELSKTTIQTISLAQVERYAENQGKDYALTKRECEIIYLLLCGHGMQSVADELCLSRSTVKTHIANTYKKLGIHKRQELVDLLSKEIR